MIIISGLIATSSVLILVVIPLVLPRSMIPLCISLALVLLLLLLLLHVHLRIHVHILVIHSLIHSCLRVRFESDRIEVECTLMYLRVRMRGAILQPEV